jgi:hypothetical protein
MNRIKAQREWSPRELAELRVLARSGMPHAEIAAKLSRSVKAISSAIYKFDVRVTSNTNYRPDDVRKVRELAARGYSDRIIGLTIGRTRTAISQIRERRGIAAGNPKHRPVRKDA